MTVKITKYISPKFIQFLNIQTRDEVISSLVHALKESEMVENEGAFFDAIIEREKIVTTGIGMGVAIPHAKMHELSDFFIAIAVLEKGVDWRALDGQPVRLIFLIGGPDDRQTEYLQILSSITLALKDEERRKSLFTAKTAESVMNAFKGL